MRCAIVLEFDNGDGSVVKRVEVMRLLLEIVNFASGVHSSANAVH